MVYSANLARGTNPSWTSGANAANPLIPIDVQKSIISMANEMSVCSRLMNHMDMPTQLKQMPVLQTKPTAYFRNGDSGLMQTTTLAWKNVTMTAEEIDVLVVVPITVINDLTIDIWTKIRPEVAEAIAVALDAAILFGTNKPASWPSDIKTAAIAAGNTVTQGTGIDVASDVSSVLAAIEADGFIPQEYAMRQDLRASFRNLRTTTNEFVFQPNEPGAANVKFANGQNAREGSIFGLPAHAILNGTFEAEDTASTNACKLIAADWGQFMLGIRQDVEVDFSNSAVIQDANGDIQFNAWQQRGMVGRFTARYGFAVPNPVNRTRSSETSRYPASILRDAA